MLFQMFKQSISVYIFADMFKKKSQIFWGIMGKKQSNNCLGKNNT